MNPLNLLAAAPPTPILEGLETALRQMSPLSLGVCVVLLLLMLGCIGRFLSHSHVLGEAGREDKKFFHAYGNSAHALALFHEGQKYDRSPCYSIYETGCKELCTYLIGTDTVDKNFLPRLRSAGRITPSHMDAVRRAMDRTLAQGIRALPGNTGYFTRTAIPALGLFGALLIWLDAAGRQLELTPLPALLPIALSLLLFVCVVAWQYVLNKTLRDEKGRMEDFTGDLSRIFDRSFVDHRKPLDSLPSLGHMGIHDGPTFSLPPSEPSRPATASSLPSHDDSTDTND